MAAASPNGAVSFSREKGKGLISLLGREGRRKKILALISRACAVIACRPKQQNIYHCVNVSVCQCCTRERERDRARETERERQRSRRHRQSAIVSLSSRSLQWRIHKVEIVP